MRNAIRDIARNAGEPLSGERFTISCEGEALPIRFALNRQKARCLDRNLKNGVPLIRATAVDLMNECSAVGEYTVGNSFDYLR